MFVDSQHNHSECLKKARERLMKEAARKYQKIGKNLQYVLEILLSEHRSFSAYEIADQTAFGTKRLQANQVYRAVAALIELGLAHRVETKNAYIACLSEDICNANQLLICRSCDQVAELNSPTVTEAISNAAGKVGFVPLHHKLELVGHCPDCASAHKP